MNLSKRILGLGLALFGLSTTACGIEGLLNGAFSAANELEVVTVSGTFTNGATEVLIVNADGAVLDPVEESVGGGSFEIKLDLDGAVTNAIVVAKEGDKLLWLLVPSIPAEGGIGGLTLDASSTASFLVLGGALGPQNRDRKTLDPVVARLALEEATASLTETSSGAAFLGYVTEALGSADGSASSTGIETGPFQLPVLDADYMTVTSALRADWWTANSATATFTQEQFDGALAVTARRLNVVGCVDPDLIRVVFEADLSSVRRDGQCRVTNGFAFGTKDFVEDDPGDKMFFTGSLHEDSPIPVDAAERIPLDNLLGAFDPNAVPMFDDGTNGDEVAEDNIWTVTFVLPRGSYVKYKYTWGTQGAAWTGTEEWPGNERLVEIRDVNGDDFVRKRDAFGDEATNKSRSNECCGLGFFTTGILAFDPPQDLTENGYPETQEQPLDGPPIDEARQYDCIVSPGIGRSILAARSRPSVRNESRRSRGHRRSFR